jgi:Mce-associated membrane protein
VTDAVTQAPEPARWRARAAALAIDLLPGAIVVAAMALTALSFPRGGVWWWIAVSIAGLAILATAVNRTLLPAIAGWSLGRAFRGIEVVRGRGQTEAVGAGRLLLRDVAHLLDTVPLFAGWLWPLRDKRRRTFADLLARTEVVAVAGRQPPAGIRTRTAAVFGAAAALSVIAAAAGYLLVYQPERASDVARTQVSRQGPKIVADMLSYDPESLQDDFARAQSLATAKYREQLVPQQEAIRGAKPAPNYYRVADAAVLNATPNRATMLLFLQGQRGAPGKERLISATVRVTFAKTAGDWLVDDLTVVSKPLPAEEEK